MKARTRVSTPITWIRNTWESSTRLKHFFPCDSFINGNLVDVKGGVVVQPQIEKTFVFNSAEKSVIPNCDGTSANAPSLLVSGSWAVLATGKATLLMCAGYIDSTYTAAKTIRCAVGDINQLLGLASFQGFGLSDGLSGSGLCQHAVMGGNLYDSDGLSYSGCTNTAVGADATGITLSQNSYFIRYALYQPGIQLESKILTSAGAISITDATLYGPGAGALTQNGATYVNAFRMHGFRCVGIALYHFEGSTAPSDYMTAVNYNGALWKTGKREVYPAAGW